MGNTVKTVAVRMYKEDIVCVETIRDYLELVYEDLVRDGFEFTDSDIIRRALGYYCRSCSGLLANKPELHLEPADPTEIEPIQNSFAEMLG